MRRYLLFKTLEDLVYDERDEKIYFAAVENIENELKRLEIQIETSINGEGNG